MALKSTRGNQIHQTSPSAASPRNNFSFTLNRAPLPHWLTSCALGGPEPGGLPALPGSTYFGRIHGIFFANSHDDKTASNSGYVNPPPIIAQTILGEGVAER